MLGKLIKHEWKAVAKLLWILHAAVLAISIIGKLLLSIKVLKNLAILWVPLLLIYIISIIAMGIGTHIYLAMRFYRNMYTEEGYLSFTLPVKPWEHLAAKGIVAIAWIIIDFITIITSILILAAYRGMGDRFAQGINWLQEFFEYSDVSLVTFIIQLLISGILGLIRLVLMYYFSVSIGQLAKTHKVTASVVTFIVTFNAVRIVFTIVNLVVIEVMTEFFGIESIGFMGSFYGKVMGVTFAELVLCIVAFWCTCNYIMSRRLNLD